MLYYKPAQDRFKKCNAQRSKNKVAYKSYRICGKLPCSFPGLLTSCRKLWNHFSTLPTTSHLSTLFNDLHFCAHLLDSPQLSSDLSLLLSTPFNSRWLISPQFHLSNFSQPSRSDAVAKFCSGQGNCLSIWSWFQHSIVLSFSCHMLSFNPDCWLLPVGPTFKHAWAAVFFHAREELWCHEQQSVKSAREQRSRTRLWVMKGEASKDTQAAQLCVQPECSEATKAAQPCALLPCFFLLDFHNVAIAIQLAQGHLHAKHIVYYSRSRSSEEQRLSCETQKNYTQRLHKLELLNRIPKPTHKNDDFDFEALFERNFQRKSSALKWTKTCCQRPFATFTQPLQYDFDRDLQKRPSESHASTGEQVHFEKPWRSHSTAICADWMAEHKRIATRYCRTHRFDAPMHEVFQHMQSTIAQHQHKKRKSHLSYIACADWTGFDGKAAETVAHASNFSPQRNLRLPKKTHNVLCKS